MKEIIKVEPLKDYKLLLTFNNNEKKIKEIFDYFETVSTEADENLLNIFSITVLEMLGTDKDILEIAKQYMGPITKKYQRDADLDLGRNIVI